MGGLRYITGDANRPPARAGISIGDSLAATYAALGVLMALHHRHATGRGQMIDSTLYEGTLAMMENTVTEYAYSGHIRERSGSILPKIAPSNAYPCQGGDMVLIAGNQDNIFVRLCEAMGRPELARDDRFCTHFVRGETQIELDEIIGAWTATQTVDAVLALMERHSVPAGRIYRAPEMLADPHFAARQSIVETQHPVLGLLKMQAAFPKLSETPGAVRWPGPALGAHNDEIWGGLLGRSVDQLADLKARGVI